MINHHPKTGVRYGVISMNSIEPWTSDELWYGPDAVDVSYQEAYDEARGEAAAEWDRFMEEAEIAAAEVDPNMSDDERERFIEGWFSDHGHNPDKDIYIEHTLENFGDQCQIDQPNIEGVFEGVTYQITWLGGAPLLWILEGPLGFAEQLCSPCVPGAADLDGGYTLDSERDPDVSEKGYSCYCAPRDWLRKD